MKHFLSILVIITMFSCSAQTQLQQNEETAKTFEDADRELNKVYQQILTDYKADKVFTDNLKASQRIWIQFRDSEMKMKFPDRPAGHYGSIQPMCGSDYKAKLTTERTEKLKIWLEGTEEGDACSGSVKTK